MFDLSQNVVENRCVGRPAFVEHALQQLYIEPNMSTSVHDPAGFLEHITPNDESIIFGGGREVLLDEDYRLSSTSPCKFAFLFVKVLFHILELCCTNNLLLLLQHVHLMI